LISYPPPSGEGEVNDYRNVSGSGYVAPQQPKQNPGGETADEPT
jgi:hypothetical protein